MAITMTREEYEKKYGVKPPLPSSSSVPEVMTREEYQARYGIAPQTVQPEVKNPHNATFPLKGGETPLQAGMKAAGNVPGSMFNMGKGIFQAVTNPIDTVKAIGSTAIGGAQKLVPGKQGMEENFDVFAQALKERYGSLENLQKTAVEDPFGFGTDILSVITGGAGLAGKTGTVTKGINTVGKVATAPANKVLETVSGVKPKLLSYTSDVPEGAFKTLLERRQPTLQAMKEGADAINVLEFTQSTVRGLRKTLSQEWQEGVLAIADEFRDKRFGLADKTARKMESLADEFGFELPSNIKSASAAEWINTLKSINELPKLMLSISPKGATIRKAREALREAVINQFGGEKGSVAQLYKNYASKKAVFDAANDIVNAYSTGKPIKQTTALNRLQNIFDENKPAYLEAILDLEKTTGADILSRVTASKFKQIVPSKFNKLSSAGGLGTPKGLTEKAINLLVFPLTSPRVAGYIARNTTIPEAIKEINNFKLPTVLKNKQGQVKMGLSMEEVGDLAPLYKEAKKYKSAEEFVKAVGKPLYHGSPAASIIEKEGFKLGKVESLANAYGKGVYLTDSKRLASAYGGKDRGIVKTYLPKGTKLFRADANKDAYRLNIDKLREQGFDGVEVELLSGNKQITIFDPAKALTKSQLTDIWKKANGKN